MTLFDLLSSGWEGTLTWEEITEMLGFNLNVAAPNYRRGYKSRMFFLWDVMLSYGYYIGENRGSTTSTGTIYVSNMVFRRVK